MARYLGPKAKLARREGIGGLEEKALRKAREREAQEAARAATTR